MKKLTLFLMTVVFILTLTACGQGSSRDSNTESGETSAAAGVTAAEEVMTEPAPSMTEVCWFHGDENAENLVSETAEIPELKPEALLNLLAEHKVVPRIQQVDFSQSGKILTLDLGEEFADAIQGLGTTGEYMMLGCLVNTFLKNYQGEQMVLTINGQPLGTGHNIYDQPLTWFSSDGAQP